jgi:hypothetical protein
MSREERKEKKVRERMGSMEERERKEAVYLHLYFHDLSTAELGTYIIMGIRHIHLVVHPLI